MIGIYGANGFIGRHLVRRLAAAGSSVRAVSRSYDKSFIEEFEGKVEFLEADLRQPIAMASSLQGVQTVVQLVSTSSPALKNDYAIADINENVLPHVEFLQNCVKAGIKRHVFLSSGGTVYGPGAPVPTPETYPTNPISSHGLTKLIVEKYIQMHGHVDGLEYIIMRLANPFGPGQKFRKGQGLIPAILDHYKRRLPVRIFGAGLALRDYIYIKDVVDAIEAVIQLSGAPQLILNIGSGEVRSVIEVINTIEGVTGYRFERDYLEARKTDVDISSLDISRARQILGWTPRTSFREGIEEAVFEVDV
ncbi:NAD-dependent epimerase/dehydratase family protein [Mesorhizobium sp. B2-5-9]|uniref:NAD-dependent epimerase/dehydratase family protein n=1 Tax=Mesorhizobium sp. B2-5-9 TaxID=2589921 RepID=UPI00112D3C2C|nr:NAD-dependent epimerase/dehydratase family protein [Mesorhizobium sp. B2-5-9]TPJ98289.1 NAD-dependent epimerase/dehydratase family protein [Mesorhizobium sp. B2-5-9]